MDKTLTLQEGVASLLAAENPETAKPVEDETPDKTQAEEVATDADDDDEGHTPDVVEDDDPEGEDPTEEDVPDEVEPFYEVTVDGEARKLKLKDLIDGYRRGHNYETKAEKLREEREAAQRETAAVTQKRTELDQQLFALQSILAQEDPDLRVLKERDPTRYLIVKTEREEALRKVTAKREHLAREHQAHMYAEIIKYTEAEKRMLLEKVPEWRDEKRAKTEQAAVTTYAKGVGFSDRELAETRDHRAVLVLRKAWLYDQGRAMKGKQTPKASKTMPAGKPQTKAELTGRERDRALERLKRDGTVDAGVAALLARSRTT